MRKATVLLVIAAWVASYAISGAFIYHTLTYVPPTVVQPYCLDVVQDYMFHCKEVPHAQTV